MELAPEQPVILTIKSVRDGLGTIAESLESLKEWSCNSEHRGSQRLGHEDSIRNSS